MRQNIIIGGFASLLLLGTVAWSQAIPAAARNATAQVGVGFLVVSPDYGQKDTQGITFYGDYDTRFHIGVEADVHLGTLSMPTHIGEDSFLIGPRFWVRKYRFTPYAKLLFGAGRFDFQNPIPPQQNGTYGVYALGGGIDFKASKRINVRLFDVEYQKWPSYPTSGLTPLAATIGVAYSFH